MKNQIILLGVLTFLFSSIKMNGQVNPKINSVIKSYKDISSNNSKYKLEFIENKNTFIFKHELFKQKEIYYRVIISDIHPQGVFGFEKNNKKFIRILSIDNGHRFIRGKFINGYRRSNTTNIIDIELSKKVNKRKVKLFILKLKDLLKKEKVETEEIFIAVPLIKKKG